MVDLVPSNTPESQELGQSEDTIYPAGFLDSLNSSFVFNDPASKTPMKTIKQRNTDALTYALPNLLLGAFTEIAESLPGIDEKDVSEFVKSSTPDGIYQHFLENKEGAKTAGAIVTSIAPILGVTKIMKSEKIFNKFKSILGERAATTLLPSRVSMMDRVAKIREEAALLASKQQIAFSAMAEPAIANKIKKEVLHEVFDTLKIGVATDLGIYTLLNESDFFFPDELTAIETAAFYGVPNLAIAGVGGAFMRYKIKNALRDVGGIAAKARNPADLPINEIFSRPENRSILTTVYAAQRGIKETEFAKAAGDEVLSKNLNSQSQELNRLIIEQTQLMAKDSPIPGVSKQFDIAENEINTVNAALRDDYSTLSNVMSIEKYDGKNLQGFLKGVEDKKVSLDKQIVKAYNEVQKGILGTPKYGQLVQKHADLIAQKKTLDEIGFVKLNRDGSMSIASNVKESFNDIATGQVKKTLQINLKPTLARSKVGDIVEIEDKVLGSTSYAAKFESKVGVDYATTGENLKVVFPETVMVKQIAGKKVNKFEGLSFKGKTAAQASMRHAVKELSNPVKEIKPITVTSDMHHLELDGVLELAENLGRDNPRLQNALKLDAEQFKSLDEVEFASITSKYREWVQQRNLMGGIATGKVKLPDAQKPTLEDLIISLNLPNSGTTGPHPLTKLFDDLYITQVDELSEVFPTLESLKNTLHKSVVPQGDIAGKFIAPSELSLRGSQLKTFAEDRKPVLLMTQAPYINPLQREELTSEAMRQRMIFMDGMKNAGQEGAPLITAMTEAAMRDPDRWNVARQIEGLIDSSQVRGDRFTQTMSGLSNQPAIVAVDAIRNEQDNLWRSYAASRFEPHNKTFNRLLSNDHVGDLNSFAILNNQQGLGWRALPDFEPVMKDGKLIGYKVPLEEHAFNKTLFSQIYKDQEIPETVYMPNPALKQGDKYEPMVISPLAAESALAFNQISQDVLSHINHLRKQSGKPPIPRKPFHLPPKNLQGKELIYLINKDTGQLHTVKAGNTSVQVKNLADEEIMAAKKQGTDLFIATETEIANYKMLQLDAFESMVDYSSTFAQTGKAKGTSFGQIIETGPEVVTRMQETLINQYNTVSKVSSQMIFEPQFRLAAFSAKTAVAQFSKKPFAKTNQLAGIPSTATKKGTTIWDQWMNRALGQKSGNKEQGIGKFYGSVEDVYDKLIQKAWDEKLAFFKGGQTQQQAQSGFDALDKATSGYNPFKDSVEFLENTMRVKPPHTMLKHASKLNNLVGLTMLRMFEIGLGLVNLGTLPTLIPPVAKALARQPGESVKDWKAANAAWSSTITDESVIWNPTRAFTSGMHYMFSTDKAVSAARNKMLDAAGKKGHLWQETVERLQLFTAPAEGYHEKMIKHYAEMSSMFVDKTEKLSRSISYGTFYNMGKQNLKLGDDAAMDFAHHMANRVIGDFRPNVRPQIFQGATGMPFGLFTTFAWNYLQRVFGYLEKGQFKSFANQMGLQASFFGAKSLPGFNQYVEHFTSNYDGTENLVDRMQNSFGSDFTDAFLFGTVGSLTGLATYTRTDIVLPGSNFKYADSVLDFAAATSFVKQTFGGIGEIAGSLKANQGFNGQQLTEIASRTFPVRSVRGWFDIAAGQTTDRRGQVIDSNSRQALDVFSRVSSIRTARNQKIIEEFARQRSQQMKQSEVRSESRKALRSAFRSGKLDGDFINKLAEDYIRSGGEPAGFSGFLRDQALTGLIDKAYLRALEISKQQSKQKDHMRLMDIISDEN